LGQFFRMHYSRHSVKFAEFISREEF